MLAIKDDYSFLKHTFYYLLSACRPTTEMIKSTLLQNFSHLPLTERTRATSLYQMPPADATTRAAVLSKHFKLFCALCALLSSMGSRVT